MRRATRVSLFQPGSAVLSLRADNPQQIEAKIREVERELGIPADQTLKIVWRDFRSVPEL